MAQTIEIEDMITVGTLAERLSIPVSRLITELMKNGVLATVNERIDFDTAQIIVEELGLEFELNRRTPEETVIPRERRANVDNEHAVSRPPVVAVMGHVDHGKTSLLDAIRGAEIAKHEAGGITQHISAYQVDHNGRLITLLDTPGHEAFAAIREHGAQLTDLALIVVAADDGVQPQTIEAIRFARKAGVRIIVAINKTDKEGADANRVKQELAEQNLLVEEWGGDTVVVEVSAKTKQGVDNLLDMILLVADVEDLRAEADGPASGLIIESHTEQGRGPVARALVENGALKRGDFIVAGAAYAKIRNLESSEGQSLLSATPATPVTITGFKTLPEFADQFRVVPDERTARAQAEQAGENRQASSERLNLGGNDLIRIINQSKQLQNFNVIVKADVQGSLTSVLTSLKALDTDEVAVRVVGSGVGAVNENDVHLAHTSGAVIYCFNVSAPVNIKRLANRDKVSVREYPVIYDLINDAHEELEQRLAPEVVETELGTLKVKAIFKTTKSEVICGGEVTKGTLGLPAQARLKRGKSQLAEAEVTNLKRGPQDVKEVLTGELCGISLRTDSKLEVQVDDIIEIFRRETKVRKL
jgi:translation initiation factor IF-2